MLPKTSEFEAKFGMTQAFGSIDGTHIILKAPTVNSQDYYNYKQFYSLKVQEVCDYKDNFIDVDYRWPGNCHVPKDYANSNINKKKCSREKSPLFTNKQFQVKKK